MSSQVDQTCMAVSVYLGDQTLAAILNFKIRISQMFPRPGVQREYSVEIMLSLPLLVLNSLKMKRFLIDKSCYRMQGLYG